MSLILTLNPIRVFGAGLSVMDTLTGGKFSAMANKVRDAFDKLRLDR